MSTPEAKVKAYVKGVLKAAGAYYFMPQSGGFGKSGVADFVVLYKGFWISIECKADAGKDVTALQARHGREVTEHGGYWVVIHATNYANLPTLLNTLDLRSPH